MGCNCRKNQATSKPSRTIVKSFRNANNTVRKASSGGKRIIRRNIK